MDARSGPAGGGPSADPAFADAEPSAASAATSSARTDRLEAERRGVWVPRCGVERRFLIRHALMSNLRTAPGSCPGFVGTQTDCATTLKESSNRRLCVSFRARRVTQRQLFGVLP